MEETEPTPPPKKRKKRPRPSTPEEPNAKPGRPPKSVDHTVTKRHHYDPRASKAVELMVSKNLNLHDACREAGYSEAYISGGLYKKDHSKTAVWIRERVAERRRRALEKAGVHTDQIVGHLVEIMEGSLADVLPENEILAQAKANGVDHLIKKIIITPIRCGSVRRISKKTGLVTEKPIVKEKIELEMYDRLNAIGQLRENFGMKQEPRANSFEESRRQDIEKELARIMERDSCDKKTAAIVLLEALGDDTDLTQIVSKYAN